MFNLVLNVFIMGIYLISPIFILFFAHNLLMRITTKAIFLNPISKGGYYISAIIGTPIHELSHAIVAKIFLHKILKISLFQFSDSHSRLGYVNHSYNRYSIYQNAGNFFIGIAPLFGGSLVIYLFAYLFSDEALNIINYSIGFNGFTVSYASLFDTTLYFMYSVFEFIYNGTHDTGFYVWLIISCIIGFHSIPSFQDMKGSLSGFVILIAVVIWFVVLCQWFPHFGMRFLFLIDYWQAFCLLLPLILVMSFSLWGLLLVPSFVNGIAVLLTKRVNNNG